MDVVTYMKINNGTNGSFFSKGITEDNPIPKPIIKNHFRYNDILDPMYHVYGLTDLQKCRLEMKRLYSRYLYFRAIKKPEKASSIFREYSVVKKEYSLLSTAKSKISGKQIMGRIAYIEQLIYQVENDHRVPDLDLKEMIANKLYELLIDVKAYGEELDNSFGVKTDAA